MPLNGGAIVDTWDDVLRFRNLFDSGLSSTSLLLVHVCFFLISFLLYLSRELGLLSNLFTILVEIEDWRRYQYSETSQDERRPASINNEESGGRRCDA